MSAQPRMSEDDASAYALFNALTTINDILDPPTTAGGGMDYAYVRWSVEDTFARCPDEFLNAADEAHKRRKAAWAHRPR